MSCFGSTEKTKIDSDHVLQENLPLVKKIGFFHLKKTGGTSAYRHLTEAVSEELVAPWNEDIRTANKYEIFGGHYAIEDMICEGSFIICFFRDPIARSISYFNYVQTLTKYEIARNAENAAALMREIDFEQCLESENTDILNSLSNYYCKNLFGYNYDRSSIFDENDNLTAFARAAIDRIDFIGISEDFDRSVNAMMARIGLSQIKGAYHEKNIEDLGGPTFKIEDAHNRIEIQSKLKKLNTDDIILYNYLIAHRTDSKSSPPNYGIGNFPVVSSGQKFDFSKQVDLFRNILFSGWHMPEDGVWSDGNRATIAFKFRGPVSVVALGIELPVFDGLQSSTIMVDLDGLHYMKINAIRSFVSINLAEMKQEDYFVSIPDNGRVEIVIRTSNSGTVPKSISLSIDKLFIPSAAYQTGDDRKLGFKLRSLLCL